MLYFIRPPGNDVVNFSGVFLHEDSYIELLKLTERYYGNVNLPLVKNCYMLITRFDEKIYTGTGITASLTVHALVYNSERGYVVALVRLNNNFTDNPVPHIILCKRGGLLASQIKSDSITGKMVPLDNVKVSGRIGIMTDNNEESPVVRRLESNLYVERYIPPPQLPQPAVAQGPVAPAVTGATGQAAPDTTPEGDKIYRGPRGGSYILKDGKRIYLKNGIIGVAPGEINIMLTEH